MLACWFTGSNPSQTLGLDVLGVRSILRMERWAMIIIIQLDAFMADTPNPCLYRKTEASFTSLDKFHGSDLKRRFPLRVQERSSAGRFWNKLACPQKPASPG
ncbi:hypothetical protein GGI42DRAFT_324986 [Trichoderma sp. SZMC 28013]